MTHITTNAPLATRYPRLPNFTLPKLRIGEAINGLSIAMGKAFCLAHVDPFTAQRPQTEKFIDADLEGRDPNW
jgi:hypothetical protein